MKTKHYYIAGFPERLKELVIASGRNVSQIAIELGIGRASMYSYLSGTTVPDGVVVVRMCRCFSVSADYLLLGEKR